MDNSFQFLDIILFAALAAFLVMRLRGVLGKRGGHSKPSKTEPFGQASEEPEEDKVIPLPDRREIDRDRETDRDTGGGGEDEERQAEEGDAMSPQEAALAEIMRVDKAFDTTSFLAGSRHAFEMVIEAFAEGETKTLRPLLSNDVYRDFAGAIEDRERAGQALETTLIGINSAEIMEAELQGRTAFVTVKFVSEQINVLRDKDGEIVPGEPSQVTKIIDVWTFARNTRSRDLNWTLVATGSPG